MKGLLGIKKEVDAFCATSKYTELEVVEALKKHYFNKALKAELILYKKKKKKVAQITRDLKISHRRFYAILEEKNIPHTKYNKAK
ncbi:hypothetical protein [Maribacter sp. 2307ULW6-5]|uniref:hypothetical protein n=1 Tax=Maribacter sp. 2307ULW6-5 TaxID=3386275 RepID=UPI0039BC5E9F